jgi:inhibitor of KinA
MELQPLGDAAAILRGFSRLSGHEAARGLEALRLPGVIEVNAVWDTIGVYFEPETFDEGAFLEAVSALEELGEYVGAIHDIPVCFEMGEDLAEAASSLDLSAENLVEIFTNWEYTCQAVGFCPGFPFLGPIPAPLERLPRIASPRNRILPGTVAFAAGQAGIYPLERPGGWNLIGRTPLTIVEPDEGYFPIRAGDTVKFRVITSAAFDELEGRRL